MSAPRCYVVSLGLLQIALNRTYRATIPKQIILSGSAGMLQVQSAHLSRTEKSISIPEKGLSNYIVMWEAKDRNVQDTLKSKVNSCTPPAEVKSKTERRSTNTELELMDDILRWDPNWLYNQDLRLKYVTLYPVMNRYVGWNHYKR